MIWLWGLVALAGTPSSATTTITVDPLTTALGYVHLQVERKVSEKASIYAGPHLRLFDGLLTEGHEPYRGLGVEVGVRWLPKGAGLEGPWVMGRTVVARAATTDGSDVQKMAGYTSVLGGYTAILGEHFVLAGGLGLNVLYYDIEGYGTRGLLPAAHTNLGVAF